MPAISSLPAAASVNTTDILPIVQSGTTYKVTFSLLPISNAVQTALDLKAPLASPTFTGTVSGITAAMVSAVPRTGTTGSANLPAGTTAQRDGGPSTGYLRFNTTLNQFEGYNGTAWGTVGGGATGGTGNYVFFENDQTVTTDYTLTTGKNAGTFGPVTINTGITVTVPTGQYWTIVGA